MQKIHLAVFLMVSAMSWAEKPAPNPADYSILVHVLSSHIDTACSDVTNGNSFCDWNQRLTVLINGKKYELDSVIKKPDLLRVGDYKSKILKEENIHTYEYFRTYEFLLPDGSTRDYYVASESE